MKIWLGGFCLLLIIFGLTTIIRLNELDKISECIKVNANKTAAEINLVCDKIDHYH